MIDTDPAIGVFAADVDDALAIFLALKSDKLEVDGITTVFGNTNVDNAHRIAKEILSVADRKDIPLYKGAYNASWLGIRTHAVNFIIDHIMAHPGEITLITLAPLTNVATAFLLEPQIAENLKAMVMMGGFLPSNYQNTLLRAEFNFSGDAHAAQIALSQNIDTTLVGLDVTTQVLFKDEQLHALQRKRTPLTEYLVKHVKSWLFLNKLIFGGFIPHDPIAVAYLLQKSLFKLVKGTVDVHTPKKQDSNKNFVSKQFVHPLNRLISNFISKNGGLKVTPISNRKSHEVKFCIEIDGPRFLDLLIDNLAK